MSEEFLGTIKSFRLRCKWLFLIVKVIIIIRSVAKLGDIVPQSLRPASKPTYIYGWAHGVKSSRYITFMSTKNSGGFWEITKSC